MKFINDSLNTMCVFAILNEYYSLSITHCDTYPSKQANIKHLDYMIIRFMLP